MTIANFKHVGLITCPMCRSEIATVHEVKSGSRKGRRYFRCYETINGVEQRCGTVQCMGDFGQKFIDDNIRPIGGVEGKSDTVESVVNPAIAEKTKKDDEVSTIAEPEKEKSSFVKNLFASGEGGDE